jgi:hypothetical protein
MLSQSVLIVGTLLPTSVLPHTKHWQKLSFYFFPIMLDGYHCKRKKGWGVLFLETMIPFAELANVP